SGVLDPFGRGRRSTFLDANGDGHPDLFVGNEEFRPDGLPAPSRLFVNDGNGTFHDDPSFGLDQQIGSDCATTGDVNGDGLYVVQGELGGTNVADVMLLNDGNGASFTEMAIPETSVGSGDVAYPIDYDRNGLTDFLVMNGHDEGNLGPIQLIAFSPAA